MDEKVQIRKNILDLSYKRNLQLINIILILGGGSAIASFTGLILNLDKIFQYSVVLFVVIAITYVFYFKVNNRLKDIVVKIKELAI